MPLAKDERHLGYIGNCTNCQRHLRNEYCQDCGVIFVSGHQSTCLDYDGTHTDHRTARSATPSTVNKHAIPNEG